MLLDIHYDDLGIVHKHQSAKTVVHIYIYNLLHVEPYNAFYRPVIIIYFPRICRKAFRDGAVFLSIVWLKNYDMVYAGCAIYA